jgi:hypothetical protein
VRHNCIGKLIRTSSCHNGLVTDRGFYQLAQC